MTIPPVLTSSSNRSPMTASWVAVGRENRGFGGVRTVPKVTSYPWLPIRYPSRCRGPVHGWRGMDRTPGGIGVGSNSSIPASRKGTYQSAARWAREVPSMLAAHASSGGNPDSLNSG